MHVYVAKSPTATTRVGSLVVGLDCKWKPTNDSWPPVPSAADLFDTGGSRRSHGTSTKSLEQIKHSVNTNYCGISFWEINKHGNHFLHASDLQVWCMYWDIAFDLNFIKTMSSHNFSIPWLLGNLSTIHFLFYWVCVVTYGLLLVPIFNHQLLMLVVKGCQQRFATTI